MSQNLNIFFISYYKLYVYNIDNIDRVKKGKIQAPILIKIQDLNTNFRKIYNIIIIMYQEICGILSVSTNLASTNISPPPIIPLIPLTGFSHFTI